VSRLPLRPKGTTFQMHDRSAERDLRAPLIEHDITGHSRRDIMTNVSTMRKLAAVGLAGALAVAAATPSLAGSGRTAAAVAGGFAAGALLGAAAANAHAGYHHPGYDYGPGYTYAPGYAYEPGYTYGPAYGYGAYAHVPAPAPRYQAYGYGDFQVGTSSSGAPIYRSQVGGACTPGLKAQDRC
jgi:hypothetical protein